MKSDGSIIIDTKIDGDGINRGINQIKGKFGGLNGSLSQTEKAINSAFVKPVFNAQERLSELEREYARITALFQDAKTADNDSVAQRLGMKQEMLYDKLEAARKRLAYEVENAAKREAEAEEKAAQRKAEAEEKATKRKQAAIERENKLKSLQNERQIKEFTKPLRRFGVRLREIATGALFFNLISEGLRNVASYMGSALKSNDQFTASLARLKGSISTAFQPIYESVLPAIITLVDWLNAAVQALGRFFAAISGKSYSQMQKNAEALQNQKKAIEGTGSAAEKAKRQLAGFDEINVLQDNKDGGGGGGSDSAVFEEIELPENKMFQSFIGSLQNAGKALKDFGEMIGKHLEWYWFNVLAPLAEWTMEEAAPAVVDLLAEAFELLGAVLDPVLTGIETIWQKMQPAISWMKETAVLVIKEITERFNDFGELLKEKAPEIETIFSNIGTILGDVWKIAEPSFTNIREGFFLISEALSQSLFDKIGLLIDMLSGITTILAGFTSGDWDKVWKGMTTIAVGKAEYIEKRVGEMCKVLGIDISGLSESVEDSMSKVQRVFEVAWDGAQKAWQSAGRWFDTNVVTPLRELFAPLDSWFQTLFENIWQSVSDVFSNIQEIGIGCKVIIQAAWNEFLKKLKTGASDAWAGIQSVFGKVAEWFGETFGDAWKKVQEVFSKDGKVFEGIKEGIVTSFKKIVNSLITSINQVVAKPFEGLNSAIRKIRSVSVLGMYPFSGLSTVSVPKIPYLAQGAVLPANKPFMAVVGDQRHGTNVEAPLTTIQEAVANVMGDQVAAMMAGFNALLAENQRLREVVENVNLGDTTIGQAADRYNQKLAIMRGG